jgi:hypothetical protein
MSRMLNIWKMQGEGVFVMRQTHVEHVFGKLCIPTGKLISDKWNEKHKA